MGDGTYNSTNRPEQIVASNVTAIAAGYLHSLFLKSDGSLWAMGYNVYGQLGDGTFNNTNRPEQIVASGVTAIAAGYYHSLFLKSDGSLWAMGNNADGELGDGTSNIHQPARADCGRAYNQIQICGQPLGGTNMQLSFVGIAGCELRAGPVQQPVTAQLDSAGDQSRQVRSGRWCSPTRRTPPRIISGASAPCREDLRYAIYDLRFRQNTAGDRSADRSST